MQFDWNLSELLGQDVFELDKPFYKESIDPREIIAKREEVSVDNVLRVPDELLVNPIFLIAFSI